MPHSVQKKPEKTAARNLSANLQAACAPERDRGFLPTKNQYPGDADEKRHQHLHL